MSPTNYFRLSADDDGIKRALPTFPFNDETRAGVIAAWQNVKELADALRKSKCWVTVSVYRAIPWTGLWSNVPVIGHSVEDATPIIEDKPPVPTAQLELLEVSDARS
jgi:hypothetical protein